MELKLTKNGIIKIRWKCFNRTFMELKPVSSMWQSSLKWVLIVPLWNWNKSFEEFVKLGNSFNRTFMELKLNWGYLILSPFPVLIVPLWNWNNVGKYFFALSQVGFNRTFMELKHLLGMNTWQYLTCFNRTFMELKQCIHDDFDDNLNCFNRTFMELKRVYVDHAPGTKWLVLIVPLWNWNSLWGLCYRFFDGFNRTFMELKHLFSSFLTSTKDSF